VFERSPDGGRTVATDGGYELEGLPRHRPITVAAVGALRQEIPGRCFPRLSHAELALEMPRPKTPKKTTVSKSDFVRSQPATLSATEVLAKAKAAGLKITPQLVYKVQSGAKAKGTKEKAPAAKAVPLYAKKTSASTTPSTSTKPPKSKAAFVRGLPASTPASEVVRQAKAAGIKIGISYIYNIRGAAKMKAKRKRATAKSPAAAPLTNGGGSRVSASAENLLKAVAAEIGLGRSIELLHDERGWVHSITRG
jgi:hypothetical protein